MKVATLARGEVLTLADTHAGIGQTLTRLAMNENSILSQWALCLGRLSAQERMAHLFCELAERLHPDGVEDGTSFELPLTQEMIGDTLGITTVHVNRTLQQLRMDGLVETSGRTVSLPDVPRLHALAGFDAHYLRGGRADRLAAGAARG